MAKQTFQMHLYAKEPLRFGDEPDAFRFTLQAFEGMDCFGVYVGPVEVEAECPDDFDMRGAKLTAKQAELAKVRAEFTNRITQIQREISQLQAIEMTVEA